MVILDVFRMGWGCAESVWVELGRYGTLVSTNHDILAQEWRIRDQISSSGLWQRRTGAGGANQVPWAGSSFEDNRRINTIKLGRIETAEENVGTVLVRF